MGSLKEKTAKAIKEKFWGALNGSSAVSAEKTEEIVAECKKKAEIYADIDNSMFIVTIGQVARVRKYGQRIYAHSN